MEKLKMIIFSDIHYLDERPDRLDYNYTRKLTQYSLPILDKLMYKINNKLKPDVVIKM